MTVRQYLDYLNVVQVSETEHQRILALAAVEWDKDDGPNRWGFKEEIEVPQRKSSVMGKTVVDTIFVKTRNCRTAAGKRFKSTRIRAAKEKTPVQRPVYSMPVEETTDEFWYVKTYLRGKIFDAFKRNTNSEAKLV